VAFMVGHFEVADYQAWLQSFYEDALGRRQVAKGHQVFRSIDNPNDVFVGVKFDSVEEAQAFRRRLLASGILEQLAVKTEPTVVETADLATYSAKPAQAVPNPFTG
jgi:hypothetical protein